MKKKEISWFNASTIGRSVGYEIFGTEDDKALVESFFAGDKKKVMTLLVEGKVNMDILVKVFKNGEEREASLLEHLVEEPRFSPIVSSPAIAVEKIKRGEDRRRAVDAARKEEASKKAKMAKEANEKIENKILDMAEFWLSMGGKMSVGATFYAWKRFDDFVPVSSAVNFPKVAQYLERASLIDDLVYEQLLNETRGAINYKDFYIAAVDRATQIRTSGLSIEDIQRAIREEKEKNISIEQ